ncbi:PH domain-containing protein [Clostridium felsineum]|uniref:Uncharacterized protein n=1 Tax=Clostridium felsineum TaxID=36839 RepID=A0A1S8LBR5_9CLOT|nr:PH domain-containing protein [Clostridium felsineum]MCR3761858.1 PH domain-containing protein [Clostridium felsineum]URZ07349.1 hypothetical protein CLROS_026870 [Clostridium felsineum]URZ12380.1 hypothetical protein CROST_031020 [Clostridium felsineum]URZ17041.1 hypothetical protein CLFE_030930 [Clostridium felsineum DSM 794]
MKINDNTLEEILSQYLNENDSVLYYCYGIINAIIGNMITADDKSYIMGFTDKKFIIVKLNASQEPIKAITVDYKKIKYVKISKWLLNTGFTINVYFNDEFKLELELKKYIPGIKEQKNNVNDICDILNRRFAQ